MTRAMRLVQNYLVCALPFVIACMVWSSLRYANMEQSFWVQGLWEILSWNLIIWFATLVFFLISLIFIPAVREKTLTRLAYIRERDEREQQITGKAARAALLSTVSLLVFLLFLSVFSVNLTQVPPEQAPAGKNRTLSIGADFGFFDKAPLVQAASGETLFGYQSLSLSKTAIVLIVLLWQVGTFHLVARRESR